MDEARSNEIILELKNSFLKEKKDISDKIVEIEANIRQCNEFINSLNKKDDNDFSIFSPRSATKVYKDQISSKRLEIEALELSLRDYYKKLSAVTKKLDSLDELDPNVINRRENLNGNVKFLKLQEDDRQRIAADLHDSVLQNLSLILHNMELSTKFIDYDATRAKFEIESSRKLVKDIIDEIRCTIFDLRPMQFDDFGFKKSIEDMLDKLQSKSTMSIEYKIDEVKDVDNVYLITVFRIIQELVTNSIKHSKGSMIDVSLDFKDSEIIVSVSDDGVGFDSNLESVDNHFGLKILREKIDILDGSIDCISNSNGTIYNIIISVAK